MTSLIIGLVLYYFAQDRLVEAETWQKPARFGGSEASSIMPLSYLHRGRQRVFQTQGARLGRRLAAEGKQEGSRLQSVMMRARILYGSRKT